MASLGFLDLFGKHQYVAVSNNELKNSLLLRIPDEIIIHILLQSTLETLGIIMDVCPRLKYLSLDVLKLYRLPSLQMALQIDQEGKNRITSQFQFEKFDPATLTISLICVQQRPRRYYTTKASPCIRSMQLIDTSCVETAIIDDYSSYKSEESFTTQIIKTEGDTISQHGKVNRKITTKKEGRHLLHVIHNASHSNNSVHWNLTYQISQRKGHEYFLLPISVILTLVQLLMFSRKNENKWNKVVDWVINCL